MSNLTTELCGVIGVLATPFDDSDHIDTAAIRANVRSSLAFGVSGFLVPADAGEVQDLSRAERILVVETVLDEVAGRVPIIGGATARDQQERLTAARALISIGCRAILAQVPYTPGEDEIYRQHITEIAETGPELFMLQEASHVDAGAPVELLAQLHHQIDTFKWLKCEVKGRYKKITEIKTKIGDSLKIGTAGQEYLEALDRGADAYMPTAFHDLYVLIYKLHRSGQRDQAKEVFYQFLPILSFFYAHPHQYFNKKVLARMGIFTSTRYRVNLPPYDIYEELLAEELIEKYMKLSSLLADQRRVL